MANRVPAAIDEWYHCYNRGVDKRITFSNEDDYERFLLLLYICNDSETTTHVADFAMRHARLAQLLDRKSYARSSPLVDIAAYALMPNHFHFIVRQSADGGLARFMQKVLTGYTMYFNQKYERTGPLFAGKYKSKHLDTDEYFKHALQYVLLNPVEIFQTDWKMGIGDISNISKQLRAYPYASTADFFDAKRPEAVIIHDVRREYFDRKPVVTQMLRDAREYYRENAKFLER